MIEYIYGIMRTITDHQNNTLEKRNANKGYKQLGFKCLTEN